MKLMREQKIQRIRSAARAAFQARAAAQPKQTFKQVFKPPTGAPPDEPALAALRDEDTGVTHTEPEGLKLAASVFFKKLLAPSTVIKTGKYLPADRPADSPYPWKEEGAVDPFELASIGWREGSPDPEDSDLYNQVACRGTYQSILHRAARNKATGPDGVPVEVLRALPSEWHDIIHTLFCMAWLTGTTPDVWTTSHTILLHKKGSTQSLSNYRPIGLTNALYKLWTSHVTEALTNHALQHDIISNTQEGGIAGRGAQRQVRNLINCFEDAYHTKSNIFVLFTDFSCCFQHDRS